MARSKLDTSPNIGESLLFWAKKYLRYKAITLDNTKANKKLLKSALSELSGVDNFEHLHEVAKKIRKAGVGVATQFNVVYPFVLYIVETQKVVSLKEIDSEIVIEWLSIATSNLSEATKLNYKNAIKNFFDFLSTNNSERFHFDIDTKSWQKNLNNAINKPPAFLSENEIDAFLSALRTTQFQKSLYNNYLYKFLFRLLVVSGLRISELINLKTKDFKIDKQKDIVEIFVSQGKGNKSGFVPIPYSKGKFAIAKEYEEYMKVRTCNEENRRFLFCNKKGSKLVRITVYAALEKVWDEAGIHKEKRGMHLLRHSHASLFYKKTGDVALLKERLRHSNINTTMKYVHLDEEKTIKATSALR